MPRGCPQWMGAVLLEPDVDVEIVRLLRPQHSGQALTHYRGGVSSNRWWRDGFVELVRFMPAGGNQFVEGREGIPTVERRCWAQAHSVGNGAAGRDNGAKVGCRLRSLSRRIHRFYPTADDAVVDAVLHIGRVVVAVPEAGGVGVVVAEEQL